MLKLNKIILRRYPLQLYELRFGFAELGIVKGGGCYKEKNLWVVKRI